MEGSAAVGGIAPAAQPPHRNPFPVPRRLGGTAGPYTSVQLPPLALAAARWGSPPLGPCFRKGLHGTAASEPSAPLYFHSTLPRRGGRGREPRVHRAKLVTSNFPSRWATPAAMVRPHLQLAWRNRHNSIPGPAPVRRRARQRPSRTGCVARPPRSALGCPPPTVPAPSWFAGARNRGEGGGGHHDQGVLPDSADFEAGRQPEQLEGMRVRGATGPPPTGRYTPCTSGFAPPAALTAAWEQAAVPFHQQHRPADPAGRHEEAAHPLPRPQQPEAH